MIKISHWLTGKSSSQVTLLALGIFILFMILVLPGQAAQAEESSNGAATPDLYFVYSKDALYQMAESYGQDGRGDYVRIRFTFDLIWPLVYGFFLLTGISWLFKQVLPPESIWRAVNLIPLYAMVFDYLENISTSIVMIRYPARTAVIDTLATIFTPVKWVFVGLGFVILLIGLALFAWKRIRREG